MSECKDFVGVGVSCNVGAHCGWCGEYLTASIEEKEGRELSNQVVECWIGGDAVCHSCYLKLRKHFKEESG